MGWPLRVSADWVEDCLLERGHVLVGRYAHWCDDWDGLTMDESVHEWPCIHAGQLVAERG